MQCPDLVASVEMGLGDVAFYHFVLFTNAKVKKAHSSSAVESFTFLVELIQLGVT